MGDDHGSHVSPCDRVDDLCRSVRSVDDDDLVGVPDNPDVVVDIPGAPVEAERARRDNAVDAKSAAHSTTTDRRTSPLCMVWKASSISSSLIRSETKRSSGSRPC